jgi:hypothetical protein
VFHRNPVSIRGIRHKGTRPLFAYGSKNCDNEMLAKLHMCVHPIHGQVKTFEPFIDDFLMSRPDRFPRHLNTVKNRVEDLKKVFRG